MFCQAEVRVDFAVVVGFRDFVDYYLNFFLLKYCVFDLVVLPSTTERTPNVLLFQSYGLSRQCRLTSNSAQGVFLIVILVLYVDEVGVVSVGVWWSWWWLYL